MITLLSTVGTTISTQGTETENSMDEDSEITVPEVELSSSSGDDSSDQETELMVTSRARRATAGNRYSTLVAQEEQDEDDEDEVAMLFAEGEGEDEDFNSDEGDPDGDMSSSSDDDDQGPNAATDDMEGEKEIEKEAKAERAKKRKADLELTTIAGVRKKPKIDPTALRRAPAPKPLKRKERVSWLPGSNAASGRTSLRKQTILHRAETHAKLKENEEQRLKLKAKREKREREREAEAPKQMTQADRLAEAERIERRNAKSLNRWEAMERKRAEEQAAKLAALKERKLEGAVITFYSAKAKFLGLKEVTDVVSEVPVEGKKRGRKPKALLERLAAEKLAGIGLSSPLQNQNQNQSREQTMPIAIRQSPAHTGATASTPAIEPVPQVELSGAQQTAKSPDASSKESQSTHSQLTSSDNPFLTGIHEYASMKAEIKGESRSEETAPTDNKSTLSQAENNAIKPTPLVAQGAPVEKRNERNEPSAKVSSPECSEATVPTNLADQDSSLNLDGHNEPVSRENASQTPQDTNDVPMVNTDGVESQNAESNQTVNDTIEQQPQNQPGLSTNSDQVPSASTQQTVSPVDTGRDATVVEPTKPPIEVISTRNLVILDKFDELPDQKRNDYSVFYNSKKTTTKPVKHAAELCPITGLPARYRDPVTGIGYANALAYKKLQELRKQQFTWSSMLGCYVGRVNIVARGVPDGFLGR